MPLIIYIVFGEFRYQCKRFQKDTIAVEYAIRLSDFLGFANPFFETHVHGVCLKCTTKPEIHIFVENLIFDQVPEGFIIGIPENLRQPFPSDMEDEELIILKNPNFHDIQ